MDAFLKARLGVRRREGYSIKVRSISSISEDLQKANKIDPETVLDVMQRVSHSLNARASEAGGMQGI